MASPHGLFFLLPDEDPAEFERHEAIWLAVWSPRDLHEHEAVATAIRAMWREIRADRLEAQVLTDLFAAGELADAAEAQAAKDKAFRALNSLLRYKARIEREHRAAMAALEALRERRLAGPAARPSEPEPTIAGLPPRAKETATKAPVRSEPERLNRRQRRALRAMARRAA